ncbi:MAG: hypothetical protein LBL47_04485 [Lactobacillus sp.]|jgi:hypothetical protein|nr:hypothetical protein [Lactobacillus sp.]
METRSKIKMFSGIFLIIALVYLAWGNIGIGYDPFTINKAYGGSFPDLRPLDYSKYEQIQGSKEILQIVSIVGDSSDGYIITLRGQFQKDTNRKITKDYAKSKKIINGDLLWLTNGRISDKEENIYLK